MTRRSAEKLLTSRFIAYCAEPAGRSGLQRHAHGHMGGQVAAAGAGIDRRAGIVAQPFAASSSAAAATDPSTRKRTRDGRRIHVVVRHLEHAVGDRELAAGRNVDIAAPDRDGRGASGDAQRSRRRPDRRQAVDRPDLGAVAGNLDRQALVGDRRADRSSASPSVRWSRSRSARRCR